LLGKGVSIKKRTRGKKKREKIQSPDWGEKPLLVQQKSLQLITKSSAENPVHIQKKEVCEKRNEKKKQIQSQKKKVCLGTTMCFKKKCKNRRKEGKTKIAEGLRKKGGGMTTTLLELHYKNPFPGRWGCEQGVQGKAQSRLSTAFSAGGPLH